MIRAVIDSTQGIRLVRWLPPLTRLRSQRLEILIGPYPWRVVLLPPPLPIAEAEGMIREYLAYAALRLLGIAW